MRPSALGVLLVPPLLVACASYPVNYGVLLFPAFQALDVFGPLDVLNTIALVNRTMNLSIFARTLTPVSTSPVAMNPHNSSFSESVLPTHTLDTIPSDLEVLLVPGGAGTRSPDLQPEIDFVRSAFPQLKYIISVCTGAGILARAGILDGRNATTNKKAWKQTIALGPKVNWVHKARWVQDGNIVTTSGISAGIDGIYAFIEDAFGLEMANYIALVSEYERQTDPSWDPFSEVWD